MAGILYTRITSIDDEKNVRTQNCTAQRQRNTISTYKLFWFWYKMEMLFKMILKQIWKQDTTANYETKIE